MREVQRPERERPRTVGPKFREHPFHTLGCISRARCSGASLRPIQQAQRARVLPDQGRVVFPGGLDEALLGEPAGAEGGHESAGLAAQHEHVGVRLVEVVVELGQQEGGFFAHLDSPRAGFR